jgi:hypothetical protein
MIDHAFVEGRSNAKVVTASPSALPTSFVSDREAARGVTANYVYLMWSYASIAVPRRAGVVIGGVT